MGKSRGRLLDVITHDDVLILKTESGDLKRKITGPWAKDFPNIREKAIGLIGSHITTTTYNDYPSDVWWQDLYYDCSKESRILFP